MLEERVLAEFEAGDERHTFLLLGEEPGAVVSHHIVGSLGGRSSMPALASGQLPPTMLVRAAPHGSHW